MTRSRPPRVVEKAAVVEMIKRVIKSKPSGAPGEEDVVLLVADRPPKTLLVWTTKTVHGGYRMELALHSLATDRVR